MDSMNITEHDIKNKYKKEESDMNIHKTEITEEMKQNEDKRNRRLGARTNQNSRLLYHEL